MFRFFYTFLCLSFFSYGLSCHFAFSKDDLPSFSSYVRPLQKSSPLSRSFLVELRLSAVLSLGQKSIENGITWHLFSSNVDAKGKLPLIATSQGGSTLFDVEPGNYLVHASFGHSSAIKRISLNHKVVHETLVLDAGGLKLDAVLEMSKKIPEDKLRFLVFRNNPQSPEKKELIDRNIKPGTIIRLNAGSYHIVSMYGSVNSLVRFDVHVEPGKVTEATVEHRAANVTLKLVREKGSEALADTSFSVLTEFGDSVVEKAGPYANMILAEGKYILVAKNRNRIYQRDFIVANGKDDQVELIANQENIINLSKEIKEVE